MMSWKGPDLNFPLSQGGFFSVTDWWIRISHQANGTSQQVRVFPISWTLKYLAWLQSCSGIGMNTTAVSKFLRCAAHSALEMPMLGQTFVFLMMHLATPQAEGLWCWPVLSLDGNKHQAPLASVCCAFHSAEVTWFLTYLLAAVVQPFELFWGVIQVSGPTIPILLKLSELSQTKDKSKTGKTT